MFASRAAASISHWEGSRWGEGEVLSEQKTSQQAKVMRIFQKLQEFESGCAACHHHAAPAGDPLDPPGVEMDLGAEQSEFPVAAPRRPHGGPTAAVSVGLELAFTLSCRLRLNANTHGTVARRGDEVRT